MRSILPSLLLVLAGSLALPALEPPAPTLVVHEWGTFTSLLDEAGDEIGGINTDDEPLPNFVHRLATFQRNPTEIPGFLFKGVPHARPDITMRLETPVIYFYPQHSMPMTVDVRVGFRHGLLTEFYPRGKVTAPGQSDRGFEYSAINSSTSSRLEWNGLKVGGVEESGFPITDSHVWLAPRKVAAAPLAIAGESERYLFYRGVGHFPPPVKATLQDQKIRLQSRLPKDYTKSFPVTQFWLADIRTNGLAVRQIPGTLFTSNPEEGVRESSALFRPQDYRAEPKDLKGPLGFALREAGLFADEAEALLSTWEAAYFKSPGLRLFFIVPESWIEEVLPLTIPQAQTIRRVLVARIELVSPKQRSLLDRLSEASVEQMQTDASMLREEIQTKLATHPETYRLATLGRIRLAEAGVGVPPLYQTYLNLGRFRHAIVADEIRRNPQSNLREFLKAFGLGM